MKTVYHKKTGKSATCDPGQAEILLEGGNYVSEFDDSEAQAEAKKEADEKAEALEAEAKAERDAIKAEVRAEIEAENKGGTGAKKAGAK